MTGKDMVDVKSIADRANVHEQISEARNVLKTFAKNPLVADFVDAAFEAVVERAAKIDKKGISNMSTVYCITLVNALEMFTIHISQLLNNRDTATAAQLKATVFFLWVIWSSLDVAMNLCRGLRVWRPPVKALEILALLQKELMQSGT